MRDYLLAVTYVGAFLVLFIPLMVNESMFFPYITGKNFAFRIIVEIIFASWILLALLDREYRPRFSWVAVSGLALMVVMFFANLLGEFPLKSFWSNFERMDGFVTLLHFYLYFVVLAHILRSKKVWTYFLHTTVGVAVFMALYGLAQSTGTIEGRGRVDSRMGNAAYMAIYMLFHIFIVALLWIRAKRGHIYFLYAALVLLFVYILLETGTRGTLVGLLTGSSVSVFYLALFGRAYPELRKIAIGGVIAIIAGAGLFFAFQDSTVVQENVSLRRLANISVDELSTRVSIWGMAYEGFQERPILGWGQGNFNYVFNEQYDPSLYAQEQWFDRVHNIFFDWLIAGGLLGFIAYFGILFASLYYLFWRPLFQRDSDNDDQSFTVAERAVLLGILAGYFTHNMVVFDNIVSYMFYAVILAYIHARAATPIAFFDRLTVPKDIVNAIAVPVLAVLLIVLGYFVHLPGIQAAGDIIDSFRAETIEGRLASFEQALARDSFADQEITEQLAQQAMSLARQQNIPNEAKAPFLTRAEEELQRLVTEKPGDARLHVFFASFYRSVGQLDKAGEQLEIARELTPDKQAVILEQGIVMIQKRQYEEARDFFREAFLLEPDYRQARFMYAATLLYTDESDTWPEVITDEYFDAFALDNFAIQAAETNQQIDLLTRMLETRVSLQPNNMQNRASLAFVYYREGEVDRAVEILETAIEVSPDFETTGACYIENLEAGNKPDEGC